MGRTGSQPANDHEAAQDQKPTGAHQGGGDCGGHAALEQVDLDGREGADRAEQIQIGLDEKSRPCLGVGVGHRRA